MPAPFRRAGGNSLAGRRNRGTAQVLLLLRGRRFGEVEFHQAVVGENVQCSSVSL
jgi:hypothetical protein